MANDRSGDGSVLERILDELQETWDWTTEELNDLRVHMASYAMAAATDSDVREEAAKVLAEASEED